MASQKSSFSILPVLKGSRWRLIIYCSVNKVEFGFLDLYYIDFCNFKSTQVDTSSDTEQGGMFFMAKSAKVSNKKQGKSEEKVLPKMKYSVWHFCIQNP